MPRGKASEQPLFSGPNQVEVEELHELKKVAPGFRDRPTHYCIHYDGKIEFWPSFHPRTMYLWVSMR